MATAKKTSKKTSSKSKAKGAKKAVGSDLDDIFSGVPGAKKKTASKKDSHSLPSELKAVCDVYVSAKVVTKAVESKLKIAEKMIKSYATDRWCEDFVSTGVRPPTCTYLGEDTQFDFIQTKRIDMNTGKIKALQMLGLDPLEENDDGERKYVHLTGMGIDMEAVRKAGGTELQDKLKAALGAVFAEWSAETGKDNPVREVLSPVVSFKDNFFDNLVNVSRDMAGKKAKDKDVVETLKNVMKVLTPRTQSRNTTSTLSQAECFTFVEDAEVGS